MAAKRKSIKDKAKVSGAKLSNKRIHRLGKQGKLKKEKQRKKTLLKKYSSKEKKSSGEGIQTSLPSIDDPLDPDDFQFFGGESNDISFTHSIGKSLIIGDDHRSRKRKRGTDGEDESEAQYEHAPRKVSGNDRNKQSVKHLLPIKTRDKLIPQTLAVEANEDMRETTLEVNGDYESAITGPPSPPPPPLTSEELFLQRKQKLIERKQTIASLAGDVINYPEKNLKKLKELRLMLYEEDPDVFITVRKLTMVSLLEVFKDVIPGYRIRPQTDNKQVKLKQDTQSLVDYETGLLNNYRLYLEFLEDTAKGGKGLSKKGLSHKNRKRNLTHLRVSESVSKAMSEIAIRCLCEMLVTHPHFNYRNNIIAVLVPIMCKKSPQTLEMICETMKTVFRTDKSGDISLEIVRLISRMLKARHFKVQPKVLDTFLALKIKEVYKGEEEAIKKLKHKEKMLKFSRRERKVVSDFSTTCKALQPPSA